jgi:hypothetical protein
MVIRNKDVTMDALTLVNLAVRFLLELCVLVAVGYWGFKTGLGWFLKTLLGIGAPVLIAVLWGMFAAPRAAYRLHGFLLLAFEAVIFGSGVAALFAMKNYSLAWAFAVIVIINRILIFVWDQ